MLGIPRLNLIEIHEQPWCPAILRDGMRAILQQISSVLPGYEAIADDLLETMAELEVREVVDLCSGAGGPWVRLRDLLRDDPRIESVLLTDLFPDPQAMAAMHHETDGLVRGHPDSVDALEVPPELAGLRTVFAAFHHFEPARAEQLLRDAAEAGRGVAIFELTHRTLPIFGFVGLTAIPLSLALMPLVRPRRLGFYLLTYAIPLIPLIVMFDGLVSCLRSYSPAELEALGRRAAPHYRWRAGVRKAKRGPLPVVFLIGVPR